PPSAARAWQTSARSRSSRRRRAQRRPPCQPRALAPATRQRNQTPPTELASLAKANEARTPRYRGAGLSLPRAPAGRAPVTLAPTMIVAFDPGKNLDVAFVAQDGKLERGLVLEPGELA